MEYQEEYIKIRLKTKSIEYGEDCRPADPMVYQDFDKEFKDREVFDIWERLEPGSKSWLGIVDDDGEVAIEGNFKTHIHTGAYDNLMEIGKEIGRGYPNMKDFYFVYLNSPLKVEEKDLKTKIVFR